MGKLLLLFMTFALPFTLGGSVDTRIFDGSTRERTEAEEGEQGEIDPNARTGWQKDKKEQDEDDAKGAGDKTSEGEEKSPENGESPKPGGLPEPPAPAPRKGLPEPPEPGKRDADKPEDEAAPPSGQPSPGVRASPTLQGISLDVALPFPADI